jgi:hypothetical protein
MKGYRWSNLGCRSRCGWVTTAPAGEGSGVTHRAAAPRPLLRWGGPGATTSLSQRGLAIRGWRGTVSSPKGILGGGNDRSSVRDGVPFFLKLGDGESVLRWSSGLSKTTTSFPLVSLRSSYASIATSGGGNRCATTAARAKVAAQFGSKICTI